MASVQKDQRVFELRSPQAVGLIPSPGSIDFWLLEPLDRRERGLRPALAVVLAIERPVPAVPVRAHRAFEVRGKFAGLGGVVGRWAWSRPLSGGAIQIATCLAR